MSFFYSTLRIGKNEKPFWMYKVRTLKNGADSNQFPSEDSYLRLGKFLRKTRLDELPQIWNIIKRDMNLIGPRPEEARTIALVPEEVKKIVLSVRPGMTDLSSLHFFDEEEILRNSPDPYKTYWTDIKPLKIFLQVFYVTHKSLSLDIWILWATFKRIVKTFFKK